MYTHKNTQPIDLALPIKLVLVLLFIISLSTLANSTDFTEVDRALNHCEIVEGIYYYDKHICVIEYNDSNLTRD